MNSTLVKNHGALNFTDKEVEAWHKRKKEKESIKPKEVVVDSDDDDDLDLYDLDVLFGIPRGTMENCFH